MFVSRIAPAAVSAIKSSRFGAISASRFSASSVDHAEKVTPQHLRKDGTISSNKGVTQEALSNSSPIKRPETLQPSDEKKTGVQGSVPRAENVESRFGAKNLKPEPLGGNFQPKRSASSTKKESSSFEDGKSDEPQGSKEKAEHKNVKSSGQHESTRAGGAKSASSSDSHQSTNQQGFVSSSASQNIDPSSSGSRGTSSTSGSQRQASSATYKLLEFWPEKPGNAYEQFLQHDEKEKLSVSEEQKRRESKGPVSYDSEQDNPSKTGRQQDAKYLDEALASKSGPLVDSGKKPGSNSEKKPQGETGWRKFSTLAVQWQKQSSSKGFPQSSPVNEEKKTASEKATGISGTGRQRTGDDKNSDGKIMSMEMGAIEKDSTSKNARDKTADNRASEDAKARKSDSSKSNMKPATSVGGSNFGGSSKQTRHDDRGDYDDKPSTAEGKGIGVTPVQQVKNVVEKAKQKLKDVDKKF